MERVSVRTQQNILRARLRDAGMTHPEIAAEFVRRYRLRPRPAFRHAYGWTLQRAAVYINDHAARLGMDPDGRASMTAPYLCELEHWPYPAHRRRLTPHFLALLATVYATDIHSLLDASDREHLRPADRLVIDTMRCASGPTGCTCGHATGRGEALPVGTAPALGRLAPIRMTATST